MAIKAVLHYTAPPINRMNKGRRPIPLGDDAHMHGSKLRGVHQDDAARCQLSRVSQAGVKARA